MHISDSVWGVTNIYEPVLCELIESPPIQRLKGISQYGIPSEFYHFKGYSRYEHSLGVFLLLRKLGASQDEQIAGLLHDVSHTAFSHIIDWVLADGIQGDESYQDIVHEKTLLNSSIPSILAAYLLDPVSISNFKKFPLLEQPQPYLCADRIDYALREFVDWSNPDIVGTCANHITVQDGRIVFTSHEIAKIFAYEYLKLYKEHWAGHESMVRYYLFGRLLKRALEKGIITIGDFSQQDDYIIKKLAETSLKEIRQDLEVLRKTPTFTIVDSGIGVQIRKKFRFVDPHFVSDGKLFLLSQIDSKFRELIERERELNQRGVWVALKKTPLNL